MEVRRWWIGRRGSGRDVIGRVDEDEDEELPGVVVLGDMLSVFEGGRSRRPVV